MNTELLKKAILRKFNTQGEFAEAIGMSHMTVSYWVTGRILPGTKTIVRLCRILDISADDLLNINRSNDDETD